MPRIKKLIKRINKIISQFRKFILSGQSGGFILLAAVIISLIWANSSYSAYYFQLLEFKSGITTEYFSIIKSTEHWINDGLMCFFFLLVGLEIKRELLDGELDDIKQAILPVAAAIGGMLIPAFFYFIINYNSNTVKGWAIPMATDIAFALAILALLGKRIPLSLKIFLAALAIVDDLGAILIIALFYTESISYYYLIAAAITFSFLLLFNYFNVSRIVWYIPFGVILWYFVYQSGIHATIAGVLFAFAIPMQKNVSHSTLVKLENFLHTPVNYIIMPIFAMANTGIILSPDLFKQIISPLGWGIAAGLILGKPIGISLFAWLAIKLKFAVMPFQINKIQLSGIGFLAGIGFTMSVFIALLSFDSPDQQSIAKIAILISSIIAGIIGSAFLIIGSRKNSTN